MNENIDYDYLACGFDIDHNKVLMLNQEIKLTVFKCQQGLVTDSPGRRQRPKHSM